MGIEMDRLVVLMFLFLSTLLYSSIITTNFVSNFSSEYRTIVDLNMSPNFTAVSNGVTLADNDYLCINLPITITANNISSFSPVNSVVECAFNCSTYSSPESAFPQLIQWMDQASFSANKTFYSLYASECRLYRFVQPANPLAPYNFTSTYRTMTKSVSGISSQGVYCYGNLTAWDGSTEIPFVYTPSVTGTRLLSVNLSTTECALMARSFETNGAMQDCWYHNTNTNNMSVIESLSINYVSGPAFSASGSSSYNVVPGGSITFTFTLNNTGDMDASITGVTLTEGFAVTSYSPSTVLAGQSVAFSVVATAPAVAPGTVVSPTATISYSSVSPVIGSCGTGSQSGIAIGTVVVGEVDPINVGIKATPSGIFVEGNDYSSNEVSIEATVDRSDPPGYLLDEVESNLTISVYNSSIDDWSSIIEFEGIGGSTGTMINNGNTVEWEIIGEELVITLNYPVIALDPGVYRVDIDSYDPNGPASDREDSASAYFVIFTAEGCVNKV